MTQLKNSKIIGATGMLSILLLASGCSNLSNWKSNGFKVGPNYQRPSVDTAEDWVATDNEAVRIHGDINSEWWRAFEDPLLEQLIETASQQNLTARAAGLRVLEARTQFRIAELNLLPQSQKGSASFSRNRLSQTSGIALPGGPRTYNDWASSFDLSWELDIWGRIRRSIEMSDASLAALVEERAGIMVTLIGDVAATYIELRAFDERLELAKRNVELQNGSYDLAKTRFTEGHVSELDVQQAISNLSDTKALIPILRQGRRLALNRLAFLLATTPYDLEPLLNTQGTIPEVPEHVVVGIPADLLRRRPDIRRSEREVAAQSARIGIAEAELYPQFGLSGIIGFNSESTSDLLSSASQFGAVTPGISWKILNYGRLRHAVGVEELRLKQAIVAYEDSVLLAHREVEDAMIQFIEAKNRARELEKSADAAARSVELVRIQYVEGESEFGRVFVLESSLVQRQDQLIETKANTAIALIRTYKALGGGWLGTEATVE